MEAGRKSTIKSLFSEGTKKPPKYIGGFFFGRGLFLPCLRHFLRHRSLKEAECGAFFFIIDIWDANEPLAMGTDQIWNLLYGKVLQFGEVLR